MKEKKPCNQRKNKKKRALWWVCVPLILLMSLTAAAVLYLLPYSRATMDLSLLSMEDEGKPAVLYAPDPPAEDGRAVTYHPMEDALPWGQHRRVTVTYDQLPPHLINAFVAIEDKRFFDHAGVDAIRTLHAVWDYAASGGKASFGGSTITQQLVKNLTGHDERTPERKLTEIFTALDLEKKADKATILTAYLNVINVGGGCFGVGTAAETYFGKNVEELTLSECAAIAAITNSPARYHPRLHPEENEARRRLILSEMLAQGYITEAEYKTAAAAPPSLCEEKNAAAQVTSWYGEMVAADVLRDLQTRLGYTYERAARLLSQGGLTIETTVDEELQRLLTAYYEDTDNFPEGKAGRPQSSAIIIDPHSGEILAVAGAVGRKEAYFLQNYATDTKRPAGSTIKPLGVYAPALRSGLITWSRIYEDAPVAENNRRPWPKNADGLYRGRVTVKEALSQSLNTVPVEVLGEIGLANAFDFLRRELHMDSLVPATAQSANDMTIASVALGQQHGGVTVRELTAAYTIFTEGLYRAPVSYRRVLDSEGRVLLENKSVGTRVLSSAEAALMTRLLETVTEEGTARGMSLKEVSGVSVAGKTGTTQQNCDRWFVGYTPDLLCGVWMGYDDAIPLDGVEGNPCLSVFDEVMTRVYLSGLRGGGDFARDPRVIPVRICPLSGQIAVPECYEAGGLHTPEIGWFIEGSEPREVCRQHFDLFWETAMPETAGEIASDSTAETETSGENTPFWWFFRR